MKLSEMEIEWRNNQIIVSSCMFCDWTLHGRAEDVREQAAQHRATVHPEIRSKRRRGARTWSQLQNKDFLDSDDGAEIRQERLKRARLNGIEGELI